MTRVLAVILSLVGLASAQSPHQGLKQPSDETVMVFGGTGADLLEQCNDVGALKAGDNVSPQQLVKMSRHVGSCEGYIAGVNDTLQGYVGAVAPKNKVYCTPSGVEMDQLIRVVKKWLEDNPSQLHLPANVLVIRAFAEAFPCPA